MRSPKSNQMANSLFRRKPLSTILNDTNQEGHGAPVLNKVLGVRDLTAMGIAAVIGAGIFSTIGQAAYDGGPGVVFLFLITAVTCGFTALCYAEFASRVPVAGSAYTYAYVTFGEIIAWVIGWALILEYGIGNVVVSISWSSYFVNLLEGVGIHMPAWLATDATTAKTLFESALAAGNSTTDMAWATAPIIGGYKFICNIPAFVIIFLVTMLAFVGMKESRSSANFMVGLKLVVLAFVVGIGVFYIDTDNWRPFMPNGFSGVLKGVSAIFFAYIGFDAISTTAEECANPQRDLPRGMIYSLVICTIIYIIVTLVITGMVNYSEFDTVADPLAYVFEKINQGKIGFFVSISAVVAATSVLLVFQIGQPRIWMSMSRDGLMPKRFGKVHPKYQTPAFATVITGIMVAIPALFIESGLMTDLTSIGTLFAFAVVCGGVLALPPKEKSVEKRFNLPYINGQWVVPVLFCVFIYGFRARLVSAATNLSTESHQEILFMIFVLAMAAVTLFSFLRKLSLIPVLGMLCCMYLMIEIPARSWMVFFGWMGLGLLFYFSYGLWKSKLASQES